MGLEGDDRREHSRGRVAVLTVALALAEPLPDSIHDLRADRGIALCPVAGHR
jgi:hypothetical protein